MAENLDRYIDHEQGLRERHRQALDNLAHSLKTPLTVLRTGLLDAQPDTELLTDQVSRMESTVGHQLARLAQSHAQDASPLVAVKPVVLRLMRALETAYSSQTFSHSLEDLKLRMHPDDLLEIVGNVLENACKYGRSKVHVALGLRSDEGRAVNDQAHYLELCIEDDGPGIPPDMAAAVVARGQRLDNQIAGQGIGLSVVADILDAYGGYLTITESAFGGARMSLVLPTSGQT